MSYPTIRQACGPSGGAGGMDARGTNADSVKGCRIALTDSRPMRVKRKPSVTGGYVAGASLANGSGRKPRKAKKATPAWQTKAHPVYGVWAK